MHDCFCRYQNSCLQYPISLIHVNKCLRKPGNDQIIWILQYFAFSRVVFRFTWLLSDYAFAHLITRQLGISLSGIYNHSWFWLFSIHAPKDLWIIWLSNLLTMSVPDECYCRNYISTFLLCFFAYKLNRLNPKICNNRGKCFIIWLYQHIYVTYENKLYYFNSDIINCVNYSSPENLYDVVMLIVCTSPVLY